MMLMDDDDVYRQEKKYLKLENDIPVTGIAISGGGIRSASFGLGVMQSLVANNLLGKFDYMSTVSGGGYLGSALTWALKQDEEGEMDNDKQEKEKKDKKRKYGTSQENFPFGKRVMPGSQTEEDENKITEKDENQLLDYIRQHGAYLTPTKNLDIISFFAVVIRSMVLSLFVYISFLTILMTVSLWGIYQIAHLHWVEVFANTVFNVDKNYHKGLLLVVGLIIISLMVIMGFIYSIGTFFSGKKVSELRYNSFIKGQKTIGWMLKISLTCFLFGSLPYTKSLLGDIYSSYIAASGSTIFGAIVGIWQYIKASKNEKNTGSKSSDIIIYAGAFALFYGVLLFAYIFATTFFLNESNNLHFYHPFGLFIPFCFAVLIIASVLFGFFVNLNFIGPHYMWRSRLMEAFMPGGDAVKKNKWAPATDADSALMEEMCDEKNPKPYHIINTNVILANSEEVSFSGRGGDNFIISPLYCGSDATGWKSTKLFQKNKARRGITLASAMATSAAALNPNAGVSGEGVTRNYVISILLSFLNLRLGYWTSNPKKETLLGSPNFFIPGLTSEIFKFGLTEENYNLLLSDGGHYENLGLYELIRRKLDLIIVSDGGADPYFNFDDLANAIEKVRVDFNTRIKFKPGYMPDDILPGTAGVSFFQKKYNISKHGFAIADIIYNDKPPGKLVYVKLAMIEDLLTDVYSYKGMHPEFPHESTSDQFFDEKQFEAYRELGYSVGWQMLVSEEGTKIFNLAKKVENKIIINARVTDVWDALTNPEKTKKYMYGCAAVSDWKKGSSLEWIGNYEGKEKIFVKGIILDIKQNRLLRYTVIDPNASYEDIPENYLNVTYELAEQDGQTILSVTQDGFEKVADGEKRYKEVYNNGMGWNPILEKIKELTESK